jgi:hypothetical protein
LRINEFCGSKQVKTHRSPCNVSGQLQSSFVNTGGHREQVIEGHEV